MLSQVCVSPDRFCRNLLGRFGTLILLLVFAAAYPAVAQDSNVLIDFSGYPADRFPTYCRDGYVADTSNPPVQTQAGEPLFTPYATFGGGEVELRRFDTNPPINERYRSNPTCNGDLQTITITFRYPVSYLSFGVID